MDNLLKAKCGLYSELLKKYDSVLESTGDVVIEEGDIILMDVLMRDKQIQEYLQSKLN